MMFDYLVLSLDIIYISVALLQYIVAPNVGPNPYLGFRVGHTLANKKVWYQANKFMGKLMLGHAILLLPLCLIPDFLIYFLILWIVPMIAFIPIGIKYATNLLEEEGAKEKHVSLRKIEPITAGRVWNISPFMIYAVLLVYMIFTYPSLPNMIAVHFDSQGNPNGWSSKGDFFAWYNVLSIIFVATAYIFVYLGKKYPMYVHPGKMRFSRDSYLKLIILAMDCALILMIFVYLVIYLYATQGAVFSTVFFILLTILPVIVPIGYLISKWRKGGEVI